MYPDGSRTDLTNRADINEKYYNPQLKLFEVYTPEANAENIKSDFLYLGNPGNDPTIQMMKETGDSTHVLSMIDKRDEFIDVFNFGMPTNTKHPMESYMRGFSGLKLFVSDFLLNFNKKIDLKKDERIILAEIKKPLSEDIVIKGLLQKIDHYVLDEKFYINQLKKIYIGNNIWLTNSEFKTCYLLFHGFNPRKISQILTVSDRFVRKNLTRICDKLHVNDNYHMLFKLRSMFIFCDSIIMV
jgi:DNA-binding CsgD family transcriptional regulator